jgi:hypothetical protein
VEKRLDRPSDTVPAEFWVRLFSTVEKNCARIGR